MNVEVDGPRHDLSVVAIVSNEEAIEVMGRTLACGTGACAVVVAAARQGRVPFDAEVEVRLPGGPLHITVTRETLEVTMRGPARRVFAGEVSLT